jgi:hypothetical protein
VGEMNMKKDKPKFYYRKDGVVLNADSVREANIRYHNSAKGKKQIAEYRAKHAQEISEYRKDYMGRLRQEARINHICITCFRNKTTDGLATCESCRKKSKIKSKKWRSEK